MVEDVWCKEVGRQITHKRSVLGERIKMHKPNIIFIMADDMGYGDVGCYNVINLINQEPDKVEELKALVQGYRRVGVAFSSS